MPNNINGVPVHFFDEKAQEEYWKREKVRRAKHSKKQSIRAKAVWRKVRARQKESKGIKKRKKKKQIPRRFFHLEKTQQYESPATISEAFRGYVFLTHHRGLDVYATLNFYGTRNYYAFCHDENGNLKRHRAKEFFSYKIMDEISEISHCLCKQIKLERSMKIYGASRDDRPRKA